MAIKSKLSIVHINTHDAAGGAAKVAWRLAGAQRAGGHDARMVVGFKKDKSEYSAAFDLAPDPAITEECRRNGRLYYEFQGSHGLAAHPWVESADLLHLHNLHGDYFNPFSLSSLSRAKPLIWTLHDMQALTGHCAHSFECERWRTGCGGCPHLDTDPAIPVDSSAQLWQDKKSIYERSRLHIVTPSQWLKDKVEGGILKEHPVTLIHNGVDTGIFKPRRDVQLRHDLGIPDAAVMVGSVANFGAFANPWKGGAALLDTINYLLRRVPDLVFLNIGSDEPSPHPRIVNIPTVREEEYLARLYSQLDLYLYTPLADNCPLVVLEAMACGTPLVTFGVGGIPELVRDGLDGIVVSPNDVGALARGAELLLNDPGQRKRMGASARERARKEFDHRIIAGRYEQLYLDRLNVLREIPVAGTGVARRAPAAGTTIGKSRHPRISIVTPSFNQGEYLEECIDSVLGQNYPNLEYIIMDGGSTDDSVRIIKKYEKHLAYWQSMPDGGQYRAINEGFGRSSGEIMAWLNSDDKYHAGALQIVAETFAGSPGIAWLMGRPTVWNDKGKLAFVLDYLPLWSRENYLKGEIGPPHIQQESTFWRRSLWDEAGGALDTELRLAGDMELWTRFFRYAQLFTLDALLGGFRSHPAQKSANFMDSYNEEAARVIEREKLLFARERQSLLPAPAPLRLNEVLAESKLAPTPESFAFFTYSRKAHFPLFRRHADFLFGRKFDEDLSDLKAYQDLVVYSFITKNIPKGARILEIGGGDSRILRVTAGDYECWNLDKCEGIGNGPTVITPSGYRHVRDYIGSFSQELPDNYFDLVFSISVFEHLPEDDETLAAVHNDINRVLKPDGLSLHCVDLVKKGNEVWTNRIMHYLAHNASLLAPPPDFSVILNDPGLHVMSAQAYHAFWKV
ncbi:MAG TPA: glycosyltransferase, partial [Geobacteraceae bacterium]|nr:glycosyltransferase [Geobacteraceae bacterium]